MHFITKNKNVMKKSNYTQMKRIITGALLAAMFLVACKKENITDDPKKGFPLSGQYVWNFEIPGLGQQASNLFFHTDSIGYSMTGDVFNTNYMMLKDSYKEDENEKRWIGVGKGGSISKDGVYFVLFFKEITDSTVTIYKRECTGKEDAETFAHPEPTATADHGWNVYYKK